MEIDYIYGGKMNFETEKPDYEKPDYEGDEIVFYEMPYGCEIGFKNGISVVISSPTDALALARSLLKMVDAFSDKGSQK